MVASVAVVVASVAVVVVVAATVVTVSVMAAPVAIVSVTVAVVPVAAVAVIAAAALPLTFCFRPQAAVPRPVPWTIESPPARAQHGRPPHDPRGGAGLGPAALQLQLALRRAGRARLPAKPPSQTPRQPALHGAAALNVHDDATPRDLQTCGPSVRTVHARSVPELHECIASGHAGEVVYNDHLFDGGKGLHFRAEGILRAVVRKTSDKERAEGVPRSL